MSVKYFVRAAPGSAERGPYDLDSIRLSYERALLTRGAVVRAEGRESTRTLGQLVQREEEAKEAKVVRRLRAESAREDRGARSSDQAQVALGAVMLLAGIVLTMWSVSSAGSGGRSIVFVGLIVFGIVRIIRGLA